MSKRFSFDNVNFDTVYRIVERRNGGVTAKYNARVIKPPSWDESGAMFSMIFERTMDPATSGTLYINK